MLFYSLAIIACLASGLSAAEHGRFGQIARDPYKMAEHNMMERPALEHRDIYTPSPQYRFLNSHTER
jgi:hypothetical protein